MMSSSLSFFLKICTFDSYGGSWGPWRGGDGGYLSGFTLYPNEKIIAVIIRSGIYIDALQVSFWWPFQELCEKH